MDLIRYRLNFCIKWADLAYDPKLVSWKLLLTKPNIMQAWQHAASNYITNRSTAARRARASVIQTLINWSCRQHLKAGPRLLSLDFCSVTVSFSLVGFLGHHLCLSFHLSPAPSAVKTPAVPSAELSCSSTMHQLQVASRKLKGKIWSRLIKIIESCLFVWYKGVKGY